MKSVKYLGAITIIVAITTWIICILLTFNQLDKVLDLSDFGDSPITSIIFNVSCIVSGFLCFSYFQTLSREVLPKNRQTVATVISIIASSGIVIVGLFPTIYNQGMHYLGAGTFFFVVPIVILYITNYSNSNLFRAFGRVIGIVMIFGSSAIRINMAYSGPAELFWAVFFFIFVFSSNLFIDRINKAKLNRNK